MKTKIYANLLARLYSRNKKDESIKNFIEEILNEIGEEMNKEISEGKILEYFLKIINL
jgi:hypothetical protein